MCVILIDKREQRPFFYDKEGSQKFPDLKYEWATLKTGDYSVKGMSCPGENKPSIAIERKELSDLFSSTGNGRERFEKEFKRLSDFDYAALVIESDFTAIFKNPPPLSQMKPKSVFRTIIAWGQRFGVHCFPCPSRSFAEKTTFLLLTRFWKDNQPGGIMENMRNE